MSKQQRKSAAKAISDSAQKIWLAGLGAFSKAQADGSRLFDELMRDGEAIEQQTRKYTKERVGQLRSRMEETADRLRKTGQSSMEKIQSLVDERIAKAVERMAVPTRDDLEELAAQMNSLNRRVVGDLGRQVPTAGVAGAARKAAGTTAAKAKKKAKPAAKSTSSASKAKAAGAAKKAKPAAKRAAKSAAGPAAKKKTAAKKPAVKKTSARASKKTAARKSAR